MSIKIKQEEFNEFIQYNAPWRDELTGDIWSEGVVIICGKKTYYDKFNISSKNPNELVEVKDGYLVHADAKATEIKMAIKRWLRLKEKKGSE